MAQNGLEKSKRELVERIKLAEGNKIKIGTIGICPGCGKDTLILYPDSDLSHGKCSYCLNVEAGRIDPVIEILLN